MNQKEYLQKYLSSSNDAKKKTKKKFKVGPKRVKIIDDDVDIANMRAIEDGEFDILNATEDAPQIVGVIDERGPIDFSDTQRWKIIADDGDGNVAISTNTRQQQANNIEDTSTPRNKSPKHISQQHSDDDLSPPRKSHHKSKKHHKKRHKRDSTSSELTDSDSRSKRKSKKRETPPRSSHMREEPHRSRNRSADSDLSPPRQRSGNSHGRRGSVDSDLSPPRHPRQRQHRDRRDRCNSDSDLSPPRARRRGSSNSNHSPPRHRRQRRRGDNYDRRRGSDSDLSPPRKKTHSDDRRPRDSSPRPRESAENDCSRRLKKTLDGKKAGLQSSAGLKEEAQALRRREAELFAKMSAQVGGPPQTAVVRKNGRRRDTEAEAAERREQEKRQEEIDAKYAKWGKGLKQVDDRAEKLKQDLYEMSKPLARYKDDKDLDALSRAQEREGDVMLEDIKRRQIAQGIRKPDEPKYQGSYMPNRFGIAPGHRWDGVDRGNGYEKKWFDAQNARKAMQIEAYKWSTADM